MDHPGLRVASSLAEQPLAQHEAAFTQRLLLHTPAAAKGAGVGVAQVERSGASAEHGHERREQALGEVGQGVCPLQRRADVGQTAAHPALPGGFGAGAAVAVEGPRQVADLGLVVQVGDLRPQLAGGHLLGAGRQPDQRQDQLAPHEDQRHRPEQQQVGDQEAQRSAGGQGRLPAEQVDVILQPLQQGGAQLQGGVELRRDEATELQPGHHLGGLGKLAALGRIDDPRRQGQIAVVALLQALQAQALVLVERRTAEQLEGRLALEAHRQLGLELAALGDIAGGGVQVQRAVGLVQAALDVLEPLRDLGPVVLGLQARIKIMQRQRIRAQRQGRNQGTQRNEPTMNAQNRHLDSPLHKYPHPETPAPTTAWSKIWASASRLRHDCANPKGAWT